MPSEITMPQLSDTMTEGIVVKWNKKVGEKVKAGEELAEVETDKATMPMESFESGTLAIILAKEGDKVPVGGRLGVIATGGENLEDVKKQYAGGAAQQSPVCTAAGSGSVLKNAQGGATTMATAVIGEVHESEEIGHPAGAVSDQNRPSDTRPTREAVHHVSPLARRIAEDRKIDLKLIHGSGPGGRIVQRDVVNFASPAAAAPTRMKPDAPAISLAPKIAAGQKQAIPLTKMRTVIAQRLQQSKQTVPHFYTTVDVDVEDLSTLRAQMNKVLEAEGVRLSIGDLIAKAVAHALLVHPALNAHFNNTEIVRFGDVNLGIAVALPDGFIVPVLRGVNKLGLRDIRSRSADLVERARGLKLKQDEMTGATFTVSNLGTYGVREFSAIINPPEVAILAIGAAEKRAVVRGDQIVPRATITLTLSADHRAVDGATAAEFLRTLKMILEEPGMMLV